MEDAGSFQQIVQIVPVAEAPVEGGGEQLFGIRGDPSWRDQVLRDRVGYLAVLARFDAKERQQGASGCGNSAVDTGTAARTGCRSLGLGQSIGRVFKVDTNHIKNAGAALTWSATGQRKGLAASHVDVEIIGRMVWHLGETLNQGSQRLGAGKTLGVDFGHKVGDQPGGNRTQSFAELDVAFFRASVGQDFVKRHQSAVVSPGAPFEAESRNDVIAASIRTAT